MPEILLSKKKGVGSEKRENKGKGKNEGRAITSAQEEASEQISKRKKRGRSEHTALTR